MSQRTCSGRANFTSITLRTHSADNPNATETFTYDDGGNLETEATSGPGTGQPTLTLTYGYDPSGDMTSVSDSLSGSGATGQGITTYASRGHLISSF